MYMTTNFDEFMFQVQQALNLPIGPRCAQLTVLIDRGSLLQLQSLFPVLIDNIFGGSSQLGWELRSITQERSIEYDQVKIFLSADGPLFNLIYMLLSNENIKFDFPIGCLPTRVRQLLGAQSGHQFYTELINFNSPIGQPTTLLLNPFDYYIFHFAFHLINPWQQRVSAPGTFWNTLYYTLCCEYILHFLPSSCNNISPNIAYDGKNPDKQLVSHYHSPTSSTSFLDDSSSGSGSGLLSTRRIYEFTNSPMNTSNYHPRNDIWRSETVLIVFSDMWLYNDSITQVPSQEFNNVPFNQRRFVQFNELPTAEYMRIIRVLVKEVHRFSDSASYDDTYLRELKKISVSIIQEKLYLFLRSLVNKWPLDASFRLVLEVWLTYIQPWRYLATNVDNIKPQQEDTEGSEQTTSDPENNKQIYLTTNYKQFIAENLLYYVVILEQVLPRFFRVDLESPKMALMLFRLAKVFDQPNLPDYIKEMEQCVENRISTPTQSPKPPGWSSHRESPILWSTKLAKRHASNSYVDRHVSGFLENSHIQESKWLMITMQKILELEGAHFYYRPLFTEPPANEVFMLLNHIKQAYVAANDIVKYREDERKRMYAGIWGFFRSFWYTSDDEYTVEERRKVPIYLKMSLKHFKHLFDVKDISIEDEYDRTFPGSSASPSESSRDFTLPSLQSRRRILRTAKYEGDPDLEPIKSYECAFLVRQLYQIALKINNNYHQTIYALHNKTGYMGRFYRRFINPPIIIYHYDKTAVGCPRVGVELPPRISFRSFAHKRFLFYFLLGAGLAWVYGYNIFSYLFILFFVCLMYNMLRAIPSDETPPIKHNYPTQGFKNISFDDSF